MVRSTGFDQWMKSLEVVRAIQRAGRVARRQERINAAPPPGISAADAARVVPAIRPPQRGKGSAD